MTRIVLKTLTAAAIATVGIASLTSAAMAETLRDKWCSDVKIRFFAGGAEGDAFASIVYNGAVQAAKDTGAQVDYVFSGWSSEKMIQQLREAIGASPNGIAMMGHPGNAAIMPLAEEASNAGIKMMYDEGPGGGHHDNMMGKHTRLGCGIHVEGDEITIVQNFR